MKPARLLLGVLLASMGLGQILDVGGFAQVLETFDLVPAGATTALAWALILGETIAAVGLLASWTTPRLDGGAA